jgi:hypothetical protein
MSIKNAFIISGTRVGHTTKSTPQQRQLLSRTRSRRYLHSKKKDSRYRYRSLQSHLRCASTHHRIAHTSPQQFFYCWLDKKEEKNAGNMAEKRTVKSSRLVLISGRIKQNWTLFMEYRVVETLTFCMRSRHSTN